jgi:hypothetical protein
MTIKLNKISNNCHSVEVGAVEIFFSYKTAIGLRNHSTGYAARIKNYWGPTTGKHFEQCGLNKDAILFNSEDEFRQCVDGQVRFEA